jgi:hypothetical protein
MPQRPTGLLDIKDPKLLENRFTDGGSSHSYAPATLYSALTYFVFFVLISIRCWVDSQDLM